MKLFRNKSSVTDAEALAVNKATKLATKVSIDAMPGYHDLFVEDAITPAKIKAAMDAYRRDGKLQGLSNIMDLLLDSDDNLQSKILVRKAPLKRAGWSFATELPKERLEFWNNLISRNLNAWVDEFIEGKLYGWQFQQIMYQFDGQLYLPAELLTYSNLDLRKAKKRLTIWDKNAPLELPDYKFISILYRRPALHSLLKYYVFYAYALNHWAQFVETYGKPPRIGKYDPLSTPKEVEVLKSAVKALGTDQAAIISKNTEIEFKDFAGKDSSRTLYESLCAFVTSRVTNAILGQTLTTEQGDTGSYAQAKVHDTVQDDIMESDLADLAEFVNTILRYTDAVNFGGTGPEVYFEVFKPTTLTERILIDEKLVSLGLEIAEDHFYDTYNVNRPGKGQKTLKRFTPWDPAPEETDGQDQQSETPPVEQHANAADAPAGIAKLLSQLQAELRACKNLKELRAFDRAKYARQIGDDMASQVISAYVDGRKRRKANSGLPVIRFEWDDGSIATANAFRSQTHIISAVRIGESFKALWDQAADIIESGGSFVDFIASAVLSGFAPDNPYHLRTEYDTAIAGAQMAGRWAEIEADRDLFPYLRYVTMRDEKVRDEHIILDGTVAAVDDVFWLENTPPNGYNCRCDVEQLTESEAEKDPQLTAPRGTLNQPDEFKQNPGKTDTLSSDAYQKLWEYAESVIDRLGNSEPGPLANAELKVGDIIQDVLNYPVILNSPNSAVVLDEVVKTLSSPAEIWVYDKFSATYLRRTDEGILSVTTRKGKVIDVNIATDDNEYRRGIKIYGV